ncbi:MAG TPA: hypothetical protein VF469_00370 [Kofleriaceae bacterium]
MSRDELLGRSAASWMGDVWSSDTDPPGATAALAMAMQLRAASVPRDALELVVVAWSSALDGLAPGASLPSDRAHALDRALAIQTRDLPALAAWTAPLRARCRVAEDLDHVIQFLLRTLTTWRLTEAIAQADQRLTGGP